MLTTSPYFSLFIKESIKWRSNAYTLISLTRFILRYREWIYLIQLIKWWIWGTTKTKCSSCTIICFSSLESIILVISMFYIYFDLGNNLFYGRDTVILQRLKLHPNIIYYYYNTISDKSLLSDAIYFLAIGLLSLLVIDDVAIAISMCIYNFFVFYLYITIVRPSMFLT